MIRTFVMMSSFAVLLAACDEEKAVPPPHELSANDISHYDQMLVVDHAGPKAHIILESREEPVWFSSVRDAFAFFLLPEEPRDIVAIYVTDMGRAQSWEDPGPGVWIEAREASYVIGSDMRGGMGAEEPVPFVDRTAAEAFAAKHGGEIVEFEGVPDDYVLGATAEPAHGHGSHRMGEVEGHRAPSGQQ